MSKQLVLAARTVLSVAWILAMLVGWVLAWSLQMVTMAVMYPFSTRTQRQDVCGHIFRTINMVVMDLLHPMWRTRILKPLDRSQLPADRPILFMFNHLSNSDPWTAIRVIWPIDCKWICKGSLFKVPFGGWGLKNGGDLAVKFTAAKDGWGTEKGSVKQLMEDAAGLLRRGQPIAVFPEGVRNFKPSGPLGEFKPGFFDLAIKEGAVIVPVAFSGTEHLWPRGDWRFGFGTAYVSVGSHVETKDRTTEAVMKEVYDRITEMRDQHPDRVKRAA